MGKVLRCRDVGVNCDFEAHGKNEAKIRAAIKDEGSSCCGGDPNCG